MTTTIAPECQTRPLKPLRLSWSGLLRHENCPRSDSLVRQGKRDKGITDQRPFAAGSITDNAMRSWLDQDDPQPGDLVPRAEKFFEEWATNAEKVVWKGEADKARVLNDVKEALARLEPWLIDNVLPHMYQPEARGYVPIHVPDTDGTMHPIELFYATDILVKRGDKFAIHDLKTTRNEQYVRGKTLGQLTFYMLGVSAKFGVPLADVDELSFITPLCKEIQTKIHPDPEDIRVMIQRITRYAQQAWAGYDPTKQEQDWECRTRCDVRKHCPMGPNVPMLPSGRVDFSTIARNRKQS